MTRNPTKYDGSDAEDSSATADVDPDPNEQAHAVCRADGCDAEGVLQADLAHHLAELHADANGHTVAVQEVSD